MNSAATLARRSGLFQPGPPPIIYPPSEPWLVSTRDYEIDTSGWVGRLNTVISRITDNPLYGEGSLKAITPGVAGFEGVEVLNASPFAEVEALTQYTLSVGLRGDIGNEEVQLFCQESANGLSNGNRISSNIFLGTNLVRKSLTFTTNATTTHLRNPRIQTPSTNVQAVTFYVDGWQLDLGGSPAPYDGADA